MEYDGVFPGSEGPIHYHHWAPPGSAGRVVVVTHGYAEHGRRYATLAQELGEKGVAVLAEDHIGHGLSSGERGLIRDFDHVVDDLHTVVGIAACDHAGVPVVMAGHSMGGLLAARYAQRYPGELAGLVLLGAVLGDWAWAREALASPTLPAPPADSSGLSRDPESCARYDADPLVYHGPYHRELLEAEMVALADCNAGLHLLTLPVLFMHGTADPFVPFLPGLEAVRRMPTATKVIRLFDGARHELIHETNRAEVTAELVAFLDRVAA